MKIQEVINKIDNREVVLIEFNENVEDCEGRFEDGMRGYITFYKIKEKDTMYEYVEFYVDEKEFEEYNKSIEKPVWFGESGNYDTKYSDSKFFNKNDFNFYDEGRESEIVRFKVISSDGWQYELNKVNQCKQRQDSLQNQLIDLCKIADKFGLYDASDFIKNNVNCRDKYKNNNYKQFWDELKNNMIESKEWSNGVEFSVLCSILNKMDKLENKND